MKQDFQSIPLLIAGLLLLSVSGCSLCCGPDDFNYGTYGGRHPRADMEHGRVGSVFSDPSGTALNLVPYGQSGSSEGDGQQEELGQPKNEGEDLPDPNQGQPDDGSYQPILSSSMDPPRKMTEPPRVRRTADRRRSVLGGQRYR